jgi:hypothetical protein
MSTAGLDLLRVNPRTYARTADRTIADPTLFLDFQSATALDPRITFSRGSQATLFDSTGTLKYAKHNLILQSQDFDTTWTKIGTLTVSTDSTSAPNVTVNADKFILGNTVTSGNAALSQNVTKPLSPARYTVSAYVKAGEFNSIRLILRDSASAAGPRCSMTRGHADPAQRPRYRQGAGTRVRHRPALLGSDPPIQRARGDSWRSTA